MRIVLLCIVIISLLTGCMVGPHFHTPRAPQTAFYTLPPHSSKKWVAINHNIPAQWWCLYRSPKLNALIETGLKNSPTLAAAQFALVQAQENVNAQIGSELLPNVNAQFTGQRKQASAASAGTDSAPPIFNLFNASVNISYRLDLFGGARRELESLRAQRDYQKYQLAAAHLTLTSNIVTTAMTAASLYAQIKATQDIIRAQTEEFILIKKQFDLGAVSEADVLSQQTLLAQTRATLPLLEKSFAQNQHTLAILLGELPSESQLALFELNEFRLPIPVPVSMPSLLVRQRPDILAAEALLHSASAQIGVTTANLYPQINLTGNYGRESTVLSTLFHPENVVWSIGGNILAPVFNGGALLAKKRGAVAAFKQAYAQYCQTILQAFKNVADSLRALEQDEAAWKAQRQAESAAKKALLLTKQQYRLGGLSYLNLLTAERNYQQAHLNRIQAQAARYIDTAALFQALGGGWERRRVNG